MGRAQGKLDGEDRLAFVLGKGQGAPHVLDDAVGQGQPQPFVAFLEGQKQRFRVGDGPGGGERHVQVGEAGMARGGQPGLAAGWQPFDREPDQARHHLGEQVRIELQLGQAGRGRGDDLHAKRGEFRSQEVQGRPDDGGQRTQPRSQVHGVEVAADPVQDGFQAAGFGQDDAGLAAVRQAGLEAVGEAGDGKQRVADLVGHFGGDGPQGLELFLLHHEPFQFHPVGDVDHDAFDHGRRVAASGAGRGQRPQQGVDGGAVFVQKAGFHGAGAFVGGKAAPQALGDPVPVFGVDAGREPARRAQGLGPAEAEQRPAEFVDEDRLQLLVEDEDQKRQVLHQIEIARFGQPHGPRELLPFQDRGQGMAEQVEAENGFLQVVHGAQAKGPDHAVDSVLAGDDDDRRRRSPFRGQGGQHAEPVEQRQAQVEQHGVGAFAPDRGQPFLAVVGLQNMIARRAEPQADGAADVRIVLDHEDGGIFVMHGSLRG